MRILVPMRGKTILGNSLVGLMLLGGLDVPLQARDAIRPPENSGRALAARRELSRCMLQHMLADRTLSYNAANGLCLSLPHAPRAEVADQTPGTMRKSRTAPSPKAASAA